MENKGKKWGKRILSVMLALSIMLIPWDAAYAEVTAETDNTPVDFVLVLDCSGSMSTADVENKSISAAKMFIDMIPVENARVGVIAFGAMAYAKDASAYVYAEEPEAVSFTKVVQPLTTMDSREMKKQAKSVISDLANQKQGGGYTTIGYALSAADEMLTQGGTKKENACIILMSDGRLTDLRGDERGEVYKSQDTDKLYGSRALDKEMDSLKEKDWPVYTLELAYDIKDQYDEWDKIDITGANVTAGTGYKIYTGLYQMQHIADETGGEKFPAFSDEGVLNGFSNIFYRFYDGDEDRGGITAEKKIKNGEAEMDFAVGEMIAETNITITGSKMKKVEFIELTDPSGKVTKYKKSVQEEKREITFETDSYIMVKLLQPREGDWKIKVYGDDGVAITLMVIPIRELGFQLYTAQDTEEVIAKGTEVEFAASFIYNQIPYDSESFYEKNPAFLVVEGTNEQFPMESSHSNYTATVPMNKSGACTVYAYVESDHFRSGRKETGRFTFQVENIPSELTDTPMEDVSMKFQDKKEIDCTKYFTKPDTDELKYRVEVDKTSGITCEVKGDILTIHTGIKAGDYPVHIRVNDGAMDTDLEQSFTIHIENHPLKEKGSGKITKTISYNVKGVPGFVKKLFHMDVNEVETIDANDYFEDPDGIPPVFEVKDLPEDSSIIVENAEPGILNVSGKSKGEVTFKLIAKDASDESISYEREVTVKSVSAGSYIWGNIWGIVVMLLIFLVLVAIFLLLTFAGRKIHGEWDITVSGRSEDEVKLRTCGAGKKKKCTLNAILRDLELPECESEQIMLKAGNNWTKPVFITGLEHAEEVEYRGKTYLAEEKPLTKAVMKKGQSIHINVNGTWITLNRL